MSIEKKQFSEEKLSFSQIREIISLVNAPKREFSNEKSFNL